MRTGASILLSFAVGALVSVALVGSSSDGERTTAPAALRRSESVAVQTAPRPVRAVPQPTRASMPPRLVIPRLDLRARIGTDLDGGPAWWFVTGRPGGGDTIAIAGHRTTHTRPFYFLDRLQPGDAIYVRWHGRVRAYTVSGRRILSAKNLHIGDARGHEILLLSACHPRGSSRQRIIVYAWPRLPDRVRLEDR